MVTPQLTSDGQGRPSILDGPAALFHYYAPCRIIICRACQCVVFDLQVSLHLRLHVKRAISPALSIREVLYFFSQYPHRVRQAQELVIPREPIRAIPGLAVYQDTCQCLQPQCEWIGRDIRRFHEHCRQVHHCATSRRRDGDRPPWAPVTSQQFVLRGRGSRLFAVICEDRDGSSQRPSPSRSITPTISPVRSRPRRRGLDGGQLAVWEILQGTEDMSRNRLVLDMGHRLSDALQDWSSRELCPLCRLRRLPKRSQTHSLGSCPEADAAAILAQSQRILDGITSPTTCRYCAVPKVICRRYAAKDGQVRRVKGASCQFGDVAIPMVLSHLVHDPTGFERHVVPQLEAIGVQPPEVTNIHDWFCEEIDLQGLRTIRIMAVFHWLG
jgi:hypothetical protein